MLALALVFTAVAALAGLSLPMSTPPPTPHLVPDQMRSCSAPPELAGFAVTTIRDYRIGDLPMDLAITAIDAKGDPVPAYCGPVALLGAEKDHRPLSAATGFVAGKTTVRGIRVPGGELTLVSPRADGGEVRTTFRPDLRVIPGFLSLVPALFAVILAVLLRDALISLFAGIWLAALLVHDYEPLTALLRCFDTYLPATIVDSGHAAILLFTMALGGMIGIITKSGGTGALVNLIAARARSRRSGQLTAWLAGLVIFFDDYASCLLVGNAVRPVTDKLRISREKLSFLVDAMAAPVSTIALISTWLGYQVGLFEDTLGGEPYGMAGQGYDIFLSVLPYCFYSFFTIAFVAAIAISLRDFGPMAAAEARAYATGELVAPGSHPLMDRELTEMKPDRPEAAHWITAVLPILSLIVIVMIGLYVTGQNKLGERAANAGLREIIAASSTSTVLLWASFGGSIIAAAVALWRRSVTLAGAMEAWIGGVKSMVMALLILVLAWALGALCKDYLYTGPWLISQVRPSPTWLPFITFTVAALISLATGSSFSTMAIVIPIAAPMAWVLTGKDAGLTPELIDAIRYATLAAVLSGAVYGDHCSPISDTTIMASMSSASDLVDHARTQAPYGTLCALAAGFLGFLPAGFGISPWVTIPLGIGVLVGVIFLIGKPLPAGNPASPEESLSDRGSP